MNKIMAELIALLTESEKKELASTKFYGAPIDLYGDFKSLTIEELSRIAPVLIKTEHNGMVPECVLSAEAINILTKRAIERKVGLF